MLARALAPLLTTLILIPFFNAQVSLIELIGILLIVGAIFLLLPKAIIKIFFYFNNFRKLDFSKVQI